MNVYVLGLAETGDHRGSWAFSVVRDDEEIVIESEGNYSASANKMSLKAARKALKYILHNDLGKIKITIFTESKYLHKGMTEWSEAWNENGWKTSTNQSVANQQEWRKLLKLCENVQVKWKKNSIPEHLKELATSKIPTD